MLIKRLSVRESIADNAADVGDPLPPAERVGGHQGRGQMGARLAMTDEKGFMKKF
ncbi:hypothetical protein M4I32_05670 [Microbacterium sp. LRZ72]|uniref:hypothetical protein n=1 Tax=Microbacterium sp. LRZ72 TaxID=2942481 RepID=UPI0029A89464|nr:hypothetical protein [Microbacterium sp. LRZ72]MDX2376285.1 hypothetical protein [Microbacterium sp. LRZ72]